MFINPATYLSIPSRIISLVPSITELLYDLGLQNEIVGITKFCIHPKVLFNAKEKIGGTKNINIKKVISLAPDLIIANKEENIKEQIEQLAVHFPVYLSDVNDYKSAVQMLIDVGILTNKKTAADDIYNRIEKAFETEKRVATKQKKVAYLIWNDPYMTVGGDTFISNMIQKAGLENIYKNEKRYPQITVEDLQKKQPDVILLSTEPYPFKEKHIDELKKHFVKTTILLADGEMFSWYGSRMLLMPTYFKTLMLEIDKSYL
ncbi:MAG: helical backbone metal receptor [Ferruginibacter sp.]|nr:helical backbone metal receptor [Ferruginibacter sp.]